jgi:hypothetical protein
MTLSILMTVTGNVATCDFNNVLTALAAHPKCVVRELDAEKTTVLCAFYIPVSPTLGGTVIAVSPVTPDMLHNPTINAENGHWMVWDETSETMVDSGVSAAGDGNYVSFLSQSRTDEEKAQARANIGASSGTGTSTAILKGNGAGGFSNAVSGDDYIPPIDTSTGIKKGNGSKGLANAVPDLDYATPSVYATAALSSASWSGSGPYTQVATATGVKSGDYPIVDLIQNATQSTAEDELASYLYVLDGKVEVTDDDEITVTCYNSAPTINLNLRLVVVK